MLVAPAVERQSQNLLEVLGVAEREDSITNLLRYCFLNSTPFRTTFLGRVCGIAGPTDGWQAETRMQVKGFGTPDLVLSRRESDVLVIIENKLKAGEGEDQTERYAHSECVAEIRRRTGLSENAKEHLCFLTLFGEGAKSHRFRSVSYRALLGEPMPLGAGDPLADQLITALYALLTPFYRRAELNPDGRLLDQLADSDGAALDGGYLGFLSLLDQLGSQLPTGVRVAYPFRNSEQGRRYYGAVIARPSWESSAITKNGSAWALEADNHNVHLETQFNALSRSFQLFVHYETNPYHPDRMLGKYVPAAQYQAYKQRRESFKARCARLAGAGFTLTNTRLQIARANLSLADATVREATRMIGEHIARATEVIDAAIYAEFGVLPNPES